MESRGVGGGLSSCLDVSAYYIHQLIPESRRTVLDPHMETAGNVCMKQRALMFQFVEIHDGVPLLPQLLSVVLHEAIRVFKVTHVVQAVSTCHMCQPLRTYLITCWLLAVACACNNIRVFQCQVLVTVTFPIHIRTSTRVVSSPASTFAFWLHHLNHHVHILPRL
jgi:hypothetical protein